MTMIAAGYKVIEVIWQEKTKGRSICVPTLPEAWGITNFFTINLTQVLPSQNAGREMPAA
jgi:hypothetical protein